MLVGYPRLRRYVNSKTFFLLEYFQRKKSELAALFFQSFNSH